MFGSENYQNQVKIKELTTSNGKLAVENYDLKNENEKLRANNTELKTNLDNYITSTDAKLLASKITIEELKVAIGELKIAVDERDEEIIELRRLINMDSSNSSLPPSSDKKFGKKKNKDDDKDGNARVSEKSKSALNLLEKLQSFAGNTQNSPKFSVRDTGVINTLLLTGEFQINGIYGARRCTLEKLAKSNFVECNVEEIEKLLINKVFAAAANYKWRVGQPGHTGHTLRQVSNPDRIKNIKPHVCSCGCKSLTLNENDYEARQEIDIIIKRVVTEYRLLYGTCNSCGQTNKAVSSVPGNISYSYNIKCYVVYMLDTNFMTYERLAQFFADMLELPISEGSINNWRKEFAALLGQGYLAKIKQILLEAKYLNADETSINVAGDKEWVHTVCNESATLLQISESRGTAGITASGVLDKYTGTLIVDGWSAYESLPLIKNMQTCLVHLMRYFKDAHENYKQQWALTMLVFIEQFFDITKSLHASGITKYSAKQREFFYKEYDRIVTLGDNEILACKYSKEHRVSRLIRRLKNDKPIILRFLDDTSLPLSNNIAEQSIRPLKVQQKISGTVLSMKNAQENLNIRSFISTVKKQKQNVLSAMRKIFQNPNDFEINAMV